MKKTKEIQQYLDYHRKLRVLRFAKDYGRINEVCEIFKISRTTYFNWILDTKIKSVSFSSIKEDVVRFIPNDAILNIWSPEYFNDLIAEIKFENT